MSDSKPDDRQERLAARLRENLRRRKAQARALETDAKSDPNAEPKSAAGDETAASETSDSL